MSVKVKFSIVGSRDVKATKIFYENNDSSISIEIDVFVFRVAESNKIWKKMEDYRLLIKKSLIGEASDLFDNNKEQLYEEIDRFSNPFPDFDFDSLIAFYPGDNNRRDLLKRFVGKITNNINDLKERDKSSCFCKKDKSISSKDGMTKEDIDIDVTDLKEMKKLLLVDDVIDTGTTVGIFLDKLIDEGIDLKAIEIKLVCIYNNPHPAGIY